MADSILLTIDVEDWFQVENLRSCCPVSSWSSYELRVERNTHKLLDLFDEISDQRSAISRWPSAEKLITDNSEQRRVHATFFVLGWIAERLPGLVRKIRVRGHEVASHGYGHELCSQCSTTDLKEDLVKSKRLLEDVIGENVHGYRAPSFSISDYTLRMIADAGYEYDSSYNSFAMHSRYGKVSLNGHERRGIAYKICDSFYELPISNLAFFPFSTLGTLTHFGHFRHFILPWGGGAYFRLIPAPLFRMGVKEILRQQRAYLFYMHPWELDPQQPRPEGTTASSHFKHYTNLNKSEGKLRGFLGKSGECRFVSCHEHLQRNQPEPAE
jgi:polysaccharide deacetylase family protein (PEP-CTERM system associated)